LESKRIFIIAEDFFPFFRNIDGIEDVEGGEEEARLYFISLNPRPFFEIDSDERSEK